MGPIVLREANCSRTDRCEIMAGDRLVPSVHLDIRRLSLIALACMVIPLVVGFIVDQLVPSTLSITLLAGLAAIPIAVIFVSRAVLADMDRVIQIVAPEDAPDDDAESCE
jgi:hypothetical protein